MERPIFKPMGTAVAELDTPALVIELATVAHNLETVHAFFRQHEAKVRPHVTTHRCPALAHLQLAAGGTVEGIAVTTIGEAEVFAEAGFRDIFVTNQVVTPAKIRRVCALAHRVTLTVAVDQLANIHALSAAAGAAGVTLQVVVELQTRLHRCGVAAGPPAVALARAIQAVAHLEFAGLTSYDGPLLTADPTARAEEVRHNLQPVLETRGEIESAGLPVRMVSVGDTSSYAVAGALPGVTEVLAGTYVLMDAQHSQSCPSLRPAARVLTTVMSRPDVQTAITDAGQKAVGIDRGLPVSDVAGATVSALSAEHCRLQLGSPTDRPLALGDTLWLTPWDMSTCANLYDYMHAVRDGRLEAVWRVAARGHYR